MFLGVKTEKNKAVLSFVNQTNERLQNQMFLLGTELKTYVKKDALFLLYEYTPFGGELPLYIGGFLSFSLYFFFALTYWLFIPLFIASLYYFNTPYFISFIMKRGLKKEGYTGSYQKLNNEQIIKELVLL